MQMMDYPCLVIGKTTSIWWRDLVGLTSAGHAKCNWLSKEILCKLGNGNNIWFWKHNWLRHIPLMQ